MSLLNWLKNINSVDENGQGITVAGFCPNCSVNQAYIYKSTEAVKEQRRDISKYDSTANRVFIKYSVKTYLQPITLRSDDIYNQSLV